MSALWLAAEESWWEAGLGSEGQHDSENDWVKKVGNFLTIHHDYVLQSSQETSSRWERSCVVKLQLFLCLFSGVCIMCSRAAGHYIAAASMHMWSPSSLGYYPVYGSNQQQSGQARRQFHYPWAFISSTKWGKAHPCPWGVSANRQDGGESVGYLWVNWPLSLKSSQHNDPQLYALK